MKLQYLLVGLAVESAIASSWFSKAAYDKWHETELERWLSDHDIAYPTPSDRKDLETLVKNNWQTAVESPYANWDTARLQKYLTDRGYEVKKGTEKNKDQLAEQVKSKWEDTEGTATNAYSDIKAWVFDSWTDSSLKAFADKNGIPVPQPRTRDSLLKSVRENYQTAATKAGETAAYPGNWLYATWSDSDLKSWLDQRGYPVPQPGKRDKLIASVRRNSYLASREASSYVSSASASAAAAGTAISDSIFDTWSDSALKAWFDKNSIKVPQGSTRNELLAVARRNFAKLTGDNVSASGSSAFHAATTKAGNEYAKATEDAALKFNDYYSKASSVLGSLAYEAQVALGLKTDYLSSASSVAAKATAKLEL